MDIDYSQVEGAIRERAERTQIAKKCSIPLSLTITTINDDVKILTADECSTAQRISCCGGLTAKSSPRYFGRPCSQELAALDGYERKP